MNAPLKPANDAATDFARRHIGPSPARRRRDAGERRRARASTR